MKRTILALMLPFALAASPAHEHYHWYPAAPDAEPRPWAILFPRAMGIGTLAPGNQYVDMASWLNSRGIDALIIDDDRAMRLLKPRGSAGEQRAALAADALADAREAGRMDIRCPGIAIGWSRGGAGALQLASQAEGGATGVKAAIAYYPNVGGQPSPWPQLHPVVALQGDSDRLAPHRRLQALADSRTDKGIEFTISLYPGAGHRFDLARPTDQPESEEVWKDFDPAAHADALRQIDAFLKRNGIEKASCALD
jgi:dienelactone hydrolase